jgi:glycosyltransferase involved in cell wall biosynthesis
MELAKLFDGRSPILDLNTGIIEEDIKKITLNKVKLDLLGSKYCFDRFDYLKTKKKLDISYLLPHNRVTGGLKILIEQANRLQSRGHNVSLYGHSPKPDWIEIKCAYFHVPPDEELHEAVLSADVVIAGYWDLVVDAVKSRAPLKYLSEQGGSYIFEYEGIEPFYRNVVISAFQLPVKVITVSRQMQEKIKNLYGRKSVLIPNAVDDGIFYPIQKRKNNIPEILMVGYDSLPFKGHDDIIKALSILRREGYNFRLRWATASSPQKDYSDIGFDIQYHIAPSQEELGWLYRTSDIYISGSYYESFSLPPLEAMASGTAVITASNEGVREYAADGKNCLMYRPGVVEELVSRLKLLIGSSKLREELIYEGLKTAEKFNWTKSIDIFEEELIKSRDNLRVALIDRMGN